MQIEIRSSSEKDQTDEVEDLIPMKSLPCHLPVGLPILDIQELPDSELSDYITGNGSIPHSFAYFVKRSIRENAKSAIEVFRNYLNTLTPPIWIAEGSYECKVKEFTKYVNKFVSKILQVDQIGT